VLFSKGVQIIRNQDFMGFENEWEFLEPVRDRKLNRRCCLDFFRRKKFEDYLNLATSPNSSQVFDFNSNTKRRKNKNDGFDRTRKRT